MRAEFMGACRVSCLQPAWLGGSLTCQGRTRPKVGEEARNRLHASRFRTRATNSGNVGSLAIRRPAPETIAGQLECHSTAASATALSDRLPGPLVSGT